VIIWLQFDVASVTCFPHREREKGVQLGKEGQERRIRQERKMELYGQGGGSLKAEMLQASGRRRLAA
jgi:hypothetical protein